MPKVYRKRKNWNSTEDNQLRSLVSLYGSRNWRAVAAGIADRDSKQCRERWINHLDPTIKKEPFTDDEWEVLLNAHRYKGNCWSEIALLLPGRTANQIKNQWHGRKRKDIQSSVGDEKGEKGGEGKGIKREGVIRGGLTDALEFGVDTDVESYRGYVSRDYHPDIIQNDMSNMDRPVVFSRVWDDNARNLTESERRNPMDISNLLTETSSLSEFKIPRTNATRPVPVLNQFPQSTPIHLPYSINSLLNDPTPIHSTQHDVTSPLKRSREDHSDYPANKKAQPCPPDNFLNLLAAASFVRIEDSFSTQETN